MQEGHIRQVSIASKIPVQLFLSPFTQHHSDHSEAQAYGKSTSKGRAKISRLGLVSGSWLGLDDLVSCQLFCLVVSWLGLDDLLLCQKQDSLDVIAASSFIRILLLHSVHTSCCFYFFETWSYLFYNVTTCSFNWTWVRILSQSTRLFHSLTK